MFFPQVLYFAKYTKVERVVPNALANVIVFGEADPPLNHRCKGGTRCPLLSVEAAVSAATPRISQATRLPLQSRSIDHDDFALVLPLVCGLHKASTDRIVPHVIPFLGVIFVAAQNVIKKSRLPQ